MVELHSNSTFAGSRAVADGVRPTDHLIAKLILGRRFGFDAR
jgi:hypothetical protein